MRAVADADENTVGYIILHWLTGQSFIHSFSSAVVGRRDTETHRDGGRENGEMEIMRQ